MCANQQPAECPGHVVTCGSCKGSGRDQVAPTLYRCSPCKGVGKVLIK